MGTLNKEDIIDKIKSSKMNFAWINTYSELKLIQLNNENNIDEYFDNLIEAKIFNENNEISVIEAAEDTFSIYEFNGDNNKDFIEEEQILNKHKSLFNCSKNEFNTIIIRHYLDYDSDGQAYVSYTKLSDVKRGEIK